jgi:branched-chain amino acid transport system substrate-binding protein
VRSILSLTAVVLSVVVGCTSAPGAAPTSPPAAAAKPTQAAQPTAAGQVATAAPTTSGASTPAAAAAASTPGAAAKPASGPPAGAPAAALAAKPAATIQGPEIKIGLITVTEGSPQAANGRRSLEGARAAVQEINASGGVAGVPIRLIETDTRGDVNATANLERRLATEDKVLAIVGPLLSGECNIGCPLANDLKVPFISPGAAQGGLMAKARPYGFRLTQPDDANSGPAVAAILKRENIKRAALIMDEKDASQSYMGTSFWPQAFKDNGVELVDTETFVSGDQSFAAQVTKLKAANPDAVAIAALSADAARIALEMRRQAMRTPIIGSGALQSTGIDFVKAGGDAIEGTMTAAQYDPDNPDPAVQALTKNYLALTNQPEVTLNAAFSYDAVYIFLDLIKRQGVTNDPANLEADRDKIKDGLPTIKDWVGMGGPTTFGADGEVRRDVMIATVKGGKFVIEHLKT